MNPWYTDLILSDDNPNPTLQVRWVCTAEQAKDCARHIEYVAKRDGVELIYNGTNDKPVYSNWFIAVPPNPSLGQAMKFVDSGIYAYQQSTKTDDESDWVADL